MTDPSVGQAARGGANAVISVLGLTSQQIASFVITLLAAGFLSAADYGIYTLAIVFVELVVMVTYTGFFHFVVNSTEDEDAVLSTMFWIMLGLGTLGGAAMFASAGALAHVFDAPELASILRYLGLLQPFASVIGWASAVLTRAGQMRRYFLILIASNLGGLVAGSVVLVAWQSLYALVVYRAIRVSLGFILFSLAVPRRPRIQFDGPLAKQATRYASGLYGSRGMTFTANFGTDLILAYLFSTAESGLYRFANRLATAVVDIIGQPLRSFALKSFGQAARESGSLDTVFARFVGANVFLMGGFAVTSVVLGEALIRFAFRPDYAAAITAFYALSVLAAARSGTALIEPSFAARKTTWVAMYYNAAWAFVMIGAVVLSAPQGIATVATAQAIVQIAASAGALFVIGRWARVDLSEGLRNLVWALALVALYAGLFFAGWTAIQTMPLDNAWQLTIGLAAAVVIAVAVSAIALRLRVLQLAVFAD